MALLVGYGAGAINPYLAFESIEDLIAQRAATASAASTRTSAIKNYIKAAGKGVLKVMSKMGISTVASYRGAQVFEAIGLEPGAGRRVLHRHRLAPRRHRPRRDRARRWRGATELAYADRARRARAPRPRPRRRVPVAARGRVPPLQPRDGVQAAARDARQALRRLQGVHEARRRPVDAARDAARALRRCARACAPPVPIDEVEPVERDRQALRDRRDVVRLDLEGGARDPRHRDEPHRRQVEHRRGRRGRRPLRAATPTATCAARRSSRWRRAASASRRSTSSTPTTCRSRWRRAPSPARAVSCRARKVYPWIAKTRYSTPGVGPHQPAAAPRHLLDRGHQAAHPRPEELQPGARACT